MPDTPYSLHAIQLQSVDILELHFSTIRNPSDSSRVIEESMFQLIKKHTSYDSELKRIGVKLEVLIGHEEESDGEIEPLPFKLRVEVAGLFSVDENNFPVEHIEDWATRNAPLILYPYVRENVYSLATRCGFQGLILPLFNVPTIRAAIEAEPNQTDR